MAHPTDYAWHVNERKLLTLEMEEGFRKIRFWLITSFLGLSFGLGYWAGHVNHKVKEDVRAIVKEEVQSALKNR